MGQYCFAGWRLSSSVTLPALRGRSRAGGRSRGRSTLHGGPVVLRPVRATPCFACAGSGAPWCWKNQSTPETAASHFRRQGSECNGIYWRESQPLWPAEESQNLGEKSWYRQCKLLNVSLLLLACLHIMLGGQTSNGRWRLSLLSVVCNASICNVTHQGATRGGPVVFRPVRVTPCFIIEFHRRQLCL